MDCAGVGFFGIARVFAGSVFGGAGREFFPDFWTAASDQTLSAYFIAGARYAGIFLQRKIGPGNLHRRYSGSAINRAIYRAGGGSDAVAKTAGYRAVAVQNVAVSAAGGADDGRLGMAFLAHWRCTKMGIVGDYAGRACVSGLDRSDETMAV